MSDLISRQAVMDATKAVTKDVLDSLPTTLVDGEEIYDVRTSELDLILGINKALQNAIKALPSETHEIRTETHGVCSDAISRQDTIDAIEHVTWYHQNRNGQMVSGANSDEHQAWYKADDVYKALEAVPSADRPQGWIPCSERLPEMCENVLLYIPLREGVRQHGIRIGYCDEDNPIPEDEDGEHNFWGMKTYGGKWHVTGWGYYDEPIPIAWMPLPAPYGGESNG